MRLSDLKKSGHWPTLLSSFLYFDVSFMVWTILGALGAQIGKSLALSPQEKGLMVAVPTLAGAVMRIVLGVSVDRFGGKPTGIVAQLVVAAGLCAAWIFGLPSFHATLALGLVLGFAGASFAVALPQAGRWYPPQMQGLVMGLAGAGNIGVVIDSLVAPRLAVAYGWQSVFGIALIPVCLVLLAYVWLAKDAPVQVRAKTFRDYLDLLRQQDAHWFCFYYTVSFGGFVGLGTSLVIFFTSQYGVSPVQAGGYAALCTLAGAMLRPVGGAIADQVGGINSLSLFYASAALTLVGAAFITPLMPCFIFLMLTSAFFGMANGSVFQLLPQRFSREIGIMTGLVGCGGGVGGFLLATMLGYSKGLTGRYTTGLLIFSGLCGVAVGGLLLVKTRWRTTWGSLSGARI
jgi:NNP family nitrate/nitrite transporter-like MFS transporter